MNWLRCVIAVFLSTFMYNSYSEIDTSVRIEGFFLNIT